MFAIIWVLVLLAMSGIATAELAITGSAQTIYDWQRDRCDTWDIPDGPARVWRSTDGQVRMLRSAERSRLSLGPDLDQMAHGCVIAHRGQQADTPGAYDDRSWIASPYIGADGRVIALAHAEFHGHRRAGLCDAANYAACWWNSIVELESTDGTTFHRSGTDDLVAALPLPYNPDQRHRRGYFNPSNIITRGDYLYAFIFAEDAPPQKRGACLIRRPKTGDPADWRAWDGQAFSVRFVDPYQTRVTSPGQHVCSPVPGISSTLSSVVWHAPGRQYLAVTPATLRHPDGGMVPGIWWTTSPDLLSWSRPELLQALPLLWRRDCAQPAAYAYPSLTDPDSPSANFETVDDTFWLYLVRIHLDPACKTGPRRDLIRLPVSWRGPSAE